MAKRQTDEERVVNYFNGAEYQTARTVFNIVRGIMKQRAEAEEVVGQHAAPKPKVKRSKRKTGSAGTTTVVSGEAITGSAA